MSNSAFCIYLFLFHVVFCAHCNVNVLFSLVVKTGMCVQLSSYFMLTIIKRVQAPEAQRAGNPSASRRQVATCIV